MGYLLEKNPARRPESAEKVLAFLDRRIDESELLGRPAGEVPGDKPSTGILPSFDEAAKGTAHDPAARLYVPIDTHWSIRGNRLVGELLAGAIRRLREDGVGPGGGR